MFSPSNQPSLLKAARRLQRGSTNKRVRKDPDGGRVWQIAVQAFNAERGCMSRGSSDGAMLVADGFVWDSVRVSSLVRGLLPADLHGGLARIIAKLTYLVSME